MKIPSLPFTVTDWAALAATEHQGATGKAVWRTLDIGDLRVRMVEYSPGYMADHWCDRGHVLYVIEGELETELRDGRTFKLSPGIAIRCRISAMQPIVPPPAQAPNFSLWTDRRHPLQYC